MWADEVKWRSSGSSNCLVGYKWKNWNERWEEYWWKENKGFNKGLVKCGRGR
jgi:hypothetical protein